MSALIAKLTQAELTFLLFVAIVAAAVTVCSVFASVRDMVVDRYENSPPAISEERRDEEDPALRL